MGWGGAITFMSRPVHLKLTTPGLYVSSGSTTFMSRPVHLKLKTPVEDSWTLCSAFRGGMGGVGWGNNVHVTSRSSQVEDFWTLCSAFRGDGWGGAITFMSRPVHLKLKTPGLYAPKGLQVFNWIG